MPVEQRSPYNRRSIELLLLKFPFQPVLLQALCYRLAEVVSTVKLIDALAQSKRKACMRRIEACVSLSNEKEYDFG